MLRLRGVSWYNYVRLVTQSSGPITGPNQPRSPRWVQLFIIAFAIGLACCLIIASQREYNPQPAATLASEPPPPRRETYVKIDIAGPKPPPRRERKVKIDIAGPSSKADPHMPREEAIRLAIQMGIRKLADAGAP